MKNLFLSLFIFIAHMGYADSFSSGCNDFPSAIHSTEQRANNNQKISDLFKEQSFRKLSLKYEWDGKLYTLHFLHNPMREPLFCNALEKPVRWLFAMTIDADSYPLSLANHIKKLIPDDILKDSDSVIDVANFVSYFRKNSVSLYTALYRIILLDKIENADTDVETLTFFDSVQLSTKYLYYQLEGEFYRVLLIHNPEKLTLKSKLSFDTWESGKLSHTLSWNAKIGIFVHTEAPQELIDHLSHLYKLSWWDCYWNLSIHNGDKLTIKYYKDSWEYTYTPYTWFTFMQYAALDK